MANVLLNIWMVIVHSAGAPINRTKTDEGYVMITDRTVTIPDLSLGYNNPELRYHLRYVADTGRLELYNTYIVEDGSCFHIDSMGRPGIRVPDHFIDERVEAAEGLNVIDPAQATALYVRGLITPADLLTATSGTENVQPNPHVLEFSEQPWIDLLTASAGRRRLVRTASRVTPYKLDVGSLMNFRPTAEVSSEPLVDGLTRKVAAAMASGWEEAEDWMTRFIVWCSCGARHQSIWPAVDGLSIYVLAVHILAWHRREALPPEELLRLQELDWPADADDETVRRFLLQPATIGD